jgi:seryl-tRNA synthetase
MLDIKLVRENPDIVKKSLADRRVDPEVAAKVDEVVELDKNRRAILVKVEDLRAKRNKVNDEISALKKAGKPVDEAMTGMKEVSQKIKDFDEKLREIEAASRAILLDIPNIPNESVPDGEEPEDNVEIRKWGKEPEYGFEPKPHWELGEKLGILDFERGAKLAGGRFVLLKGAGARLERALVDFMLDMHTANGYTEIWPPLMVNSETMTGTGQLPKFAEDLYKCENDDLWLIPTAEVPVTNIHRDDILDADELTKKYVCYTPCFRREAGSYGKDVRGVIRQHQFNKVELVKFTKPEDSWDELEALTADAEAVMQSLGLYYRVIVLCTGDLGFSAAKTYDIEGWIPSSGGFKEISSCSNFTDFQARRINIRYRPEPKAKPELVHTLNGSGVAIGRTMAAIMEQFQQADGSILIPEKLQPFMGGATVIK